MTNKGATPVQLDPGAIEFNKPGYTSYRTNALDAAREAAEAAGVPFEPTPPPVVGTTTTINVSETSTGNYSHATGTATTRPSADQGAANLGNAIGNAFAARHFAAAQSEAARFANFLMAFALDEVRGPIAPGETQIAVATFEQVKMKKAPFDVTVSVAGSEFVFRFQEWN